METNNPYEPPHRNFDKRRRFRVSLSSTEIFTIGAVFAVLVLMFAPAQPHPKEYTAIEKILIALTWNWLTIVATILGFAALLTGTYHAIGRIWHRFDHLGGASSESPE
jgi:hypothetical protein